MSAAPRIKAEATDMQKHQTKMTIGNVLIISAHGTLFNHVDEGLPMWAGDGDRKVVTRVVFRTPFATPPVITLGLTGIDSAHDQNLRFWLSAQDITETGFKIEFSTWGDTHLARAAVSWHALGQAAGSRQSADPAKVATVFGVGGRNQ